LPSASPAPSQTSSPTARSLNSPALAPDWVAPANAVNDGLLGVALLAVHRAGKLRAPVLAWAGAWLLAVMLIKLTTLVDRGGSIRGVAARGDDRRSPRMQIATWPSGCGRWRAATRRPSPAGS